jgi:tetratricopeptide (TPR) repeat protein
MNTGDYLKVMQQAKAAGTTIICPYCGAKTLGLPSGTICGNCENLISTQSGGRYGSPQYISSMEGIHDSIRKKSYAEAYPAFERLIGMPEDPFLLYTEALAYIENSNFETTLISYDKQGFMEENIAHRNASISLLSTAKMLLNKAVYLSETNGKGDISMAYLQFLAYLKLGDLKAADDAAGKLKGSTPLLENYSQMLLANAMGNYPKVLEYADSLLVRDTFSINALYYSAYALFKKGDRKVAKTLLAEFLAVAESESANRLKDVLHDL